MLLDPLTALLLLGHDLVQLPVGRAGQLFILVWKVVELLDDFHRIQQRSQRFIVCTLLARLLSHLLEVAAHGVVQATLGEGAALTPTVAVVVDAGDVARVASLA